MIRGRGAASAEEEAAAEPENTEPTPEVLELLVSRMKKEYSCAQAVLSITSSKSRDNVQLARRKHS